MILHCKIWVLTKFAHDIVCTLYILLFRSACGKATYDDELWFHHSFFRFIQKSHNVTNVCLKSFFNKQNLIQQWTVMTSVKEWTLLFDLNTQVHLMVLTVSWKHVSEMYYPGSEKKKSVITELLNQAIYLLSSETHQLGSIHDYG